MKVQKQKPTKKITRVTDVQSTWRAHGWKPTTPSERKKKANFKDLWKVS